MVWTSAKKPINIVTSYHVISLFFHLILIFSLHCQLFSLISGYYTTCNIKITYQCKIIIVPEEGWFGQPKYSTPKKKILLRCVDFCFYFLHWIKAWSNVATVNLHYRSECAIESTSYVAWATLDIVQIHSKIAGLNLFIGKYLYSITLLKLNYHCAYVYLSSPWTSDFTHFQRSTFTLLCNIHTIQYKLTLSLT